MELFGGGKRLRDFAKQICGANKSPIKRIFTISITIRTANNLCKISQPFTNLTFKSHQPLNISPYIHKFFLQNS
jgi:hypothetical protein